MTEEDEEKKRKAELAAARVPSLDATAQLGSLLGTVGTAGLNADYVKPEYQPELDPANKLKPASKDPAATTSQITAADDGPSNQSPQLSKLEAFANILPGSSAQEKFRQNVAASFSELAMGCLGEATLNLFSQAAQANIHEAFKVEYLRQANHLPGTSVEDLAEGKQSNEIRLRIKGLSPGIMQYFGLEIESGKCAVLKDQRLIQNDLDHDFLTSRFSNALLDQFGQADSVAKLASEADIYIPAAYNPDHLDELEISLPTDEYSDNEDSQYRKKTLSEYARTLQLEPHYKNQYYETIFYKTNEPRLRQEAIQGLRDEFLSGANHGALEILQRLSTCKASIELKIAEIQNNAGSIMRVLTLLAHLAEHNNIAREQFESYPDKLLIEKTKNAANEQAAYFSEQIRLAERAYLNSNDDELSSEQQDSLRETALKAIQTITEECLNATSCDKFSQMLQNIISIQAQLTISKTENPEVAAEQAEILLTLYSYCDHDKSTKYLKHVDAVLNEINSVERLHFELASGGARAQKALQTLKDASPNLKDEMCRLRLSTILTGLNSSSSSALLTEAKLALSEELEQGNETANEYLDWVRTGESTQNISEALERRDLFDIDSVRSTALVIKTELDRLAQMSREGNSEAKAALLGLLLFDTDEELLQSWLLNQEGKKPFIANMSNISEAESTIIKEQASLALSASIKHNSDKPFLNALDAMVLSFLLAQAYAIEHKSIQKCVELVFNAAMQTNSKDAAAEGLLRALNSNRDGTTRLCAIVLRMANAGALNEQHFDTLRKLAVTGCPGAILTLTGIAGGAATETDSIQARLYLEEAARESSNKDLILEAVMNEYSEQGASSLLLSCMAKIANIDETVNESILSQIRDSFKKSPDCTIPAEFDDSINAFLLLSNCWEEQDYLLLCNALNEKSDKHFRSLAEYLNSNISEKLATYLCQKIKSGSKEELLFAVQHLEHVSGYLDADIKKGLEFLTSTEGTSELRNSGFADGDISTLLEYASKIVKVADTPASLNKPSKQHETITVPQRTGVTPYEAIIALNAASAVDGDSLHTNSPGWEETRSMYDKKIQEGFMSVQHAKKLLSLNKDLKELLESLLNGELLSKTGFYALISLDENGINRALALPRRTYNDVLIACIDRGLISFDDFKGILALEDPHRRLLFKFMASCLSKRLFSSELFKLFFGLSIADQLVLADAISTQNQNSKSLTIDTVFLLLNAAKRKQAGVEISDSACLLKALLLGTLDDVGLDDFLTLDDNSRNAIVSLLTAAAPKAEITHSIIQKLKTGEFSTTQVKDLASACSQGWLPADSLEQAISQDLPVRKALFERLSTELHSVKAAHFSVLEFLMRMGPLDLMRQQGVINEPTMRFLASQHPSDLLIFGLLYSQASKSLTYRLPKDSIQQIIQEARQAMHPLTLNAYLDAIESGIIDRDLLKSTFAQDANIRSAAEKLLRNQATLFIESYKDSKFAGMEDLAAALPLAVLSVFPEQFYKLEFALPDEPAENQLIDEISEILEFLYNESPLAALKTLISKAQRIDPKTKKACEISWSDHKLSISDLSKKDHLNRILQSIRAQIQTYEHSPITICNILRMTDVVVQLPLNREFSLRNSSIIIDNKYRRPCSNQETLFIESIQNSQIGRAILGKMAWGLLEQWIRCKQSNSAKVALSQEFESAAEFAELRDYWDKTNKSTEQALKIALPAIDVAAIYRQAGLSTSSVKIILGNQHLQGEREFFYQYLERTDGDDGQRIYKKESENTGIKSGHETSKTSINSQRSGSTICFDLASGHSAELNLPEGSLEKIDAAYKEFMEELKNASALFGVPRSSKMGALAQKFDSEFAGILRSAGIMLQESRQPYTRAIYNIQLSSNYVVPRVGTSSNTQTMDLNTKEGLLRLLTEHPNGVEIFHCLQETENSQIGPEFDPRLIDARPSNDEHSELSLEQRYALTNAILNDSNGYFKVAYKIPSTGLSLKIELAVYTFGDDDISHPKAAFNRAEEWSHLMFFLNNMSPISKGGQILAKAAKDGLLDDLSGNKQTLIFENDFVQVLRDFGIKPDPTVWENETFHRKELDSRLASLKEAQT